MWPVEDSEPQQSEDWTDKWLNGIITLVVMAVAACIMWVIFVVMINLTIFSLMWLIVLAVLGTPAYVLIYRKVKKYFESQ